MAESSLPERDGVCDVRPGVVTDVTAAPDALDGQWSYAYENGADSGMVSVKNLTASFSDGYEHTMSRRDGRPVLYAGTKREAVVTGNDGAQVTWDCGGMQIVWTRQLLLHVTVRRMSGAMVFESEALPSGTPLAELDARVRKVAGAVGQSSVLTLVAGGQALTGKDVLDSSMCELTAVFAPESFKMVDIDGRTRFEVPETLTVLKKRVCKEAYGTTAFFEDRLSGKRLAVKKVVNLFNDLQDASRIIFEVKLLRRLQHENVLAIVDLFPPASPDFDTAYIATAFMEADLHRVCYSKQPLTEEHHQYFVYQTLRGLQYVHSAGVVHGSIRPECLTVSRNCLLKICDFKDALIENAEQHLELDLSNSIPLSRWHAAPERILGRKASGAQDIWSVGTVLGELLGRKILFPGHDSLSQVKKHLAILGTPSAADLDWLPDRDLSRKFITHLPTTTRRPWADVFPDSSEAAHGMLEALLTFHPLRRVTAREALALPFLEEHHVLEDEPIAEAKLELEILELSRRSLCAHLYRECAELRPHIWERDSERLRELGEVSA